MNTTSVLRTILLLVIVAALLSGCGDDEQSAEQPTLEEIREEAKRTDPQKSIQDSLLQVADTLPEPEIDTTFVSQGPRDINNFKFIEVDQKLLDSNATTVTVHWILKLQNRVADTLPLKARFRWFKDSPDNVVFEQIERGLRLPPNGTWGLMDSIEIPTHKFQNAEDLKVDVAYE